MELERAARRGAGSIHLPSLRFWAESGETYILNVYL